MGLLDVWSAIRMACALKLYYIAEQFSLMQIEDFFQTLVEVVASSPQCLLVLTVTYW